MPRLALAMIGAVLPNALKRVYLRTMLGARLGPGVRIGFGTILWADRITIGAGTVIGRFCRIKASDFRVDSHSSIGDFVRITVHRCHMHSRTIISSHATVAGAAGDPQSVLRMGMHSWIFQDCYVNVFRPVIMGRNVGVGGGTYIFTHGFWLSKLDGFPVAFGPVELGDDVWIPWGCFLLPGVKIGSRVVMGARSLVNKDVPDGALIGGIPAKIIRERSYRDVTHDEKMQMLEEVTAEFAANRGETVRADACADWTDLRVRDAVLLRLHRKPTPPRDALAPEALNITPDAPSPGSAEGRAWLSLADYRSSPYGSFSREVRDWLNHARVIGLRFYPVDELAQYAEEA